jgi:ABC-type transport system involved in multi-copper enzyme maturation permease subunit
MRGLLSAEALRFRSRRLVRVLALVALAILLLTLVRLFFASSRDTTDARRRAEKEFALQKQGCEQRGSGAPGGEEVPAGVTCPYFIDETGTAHELTVEMLFQDPRIQARRSLRTTAQAVAGGMALIGFILGASFIGAEWNAGTMQALLFWEPRRVRVLVAKAVALVAGVVVLTAVLQAVGYGGMYLLTATRGSTEGVTAGLQASVLLVMLRGMVVVTATALLGYAVAGLARVTGAALGGAFLYFFVFEQILAGLRPGWQRFLFTANIGALLAKKIDVATARGLLEPPEHVYRLTASRGVVTLAVYLAVLLGAFFVTFTRRDVT